MAYIQEQALSCTMCGTSEWEWAENPHSYTTEEKFCRGCYIKNAAADDAGKLPGTTVILVPSTTESLARAKVVNDRRAKISVETRADSSE